MSDMKCPFCNKPMKEQIDGTCISYQVWKEMAVLRDKKNIFTKSMCMEKEFAEEECKRLQNELDRTRKALDVAVDKLKGIKTYYDDSYADPHFVNWHIVAQRLANDANDALEQIKDNDKEEK